MDKLRGLLILAVLFLGLILLAGCRDDRPAATPGEGGISLQVPPAAPDPADGSGHYLKGVPAEEVAVLLAGTADTGFIPTAEETIYPIPTSYRVSKHVDHGRITWTVTMRGIPGPFKLVRNSQGQVFITRRSEEAGQEADQVEISEELRRRGLAEFNLSQVETYGVGYESKNFFNFKLSDGQNWALFSSQWEGGKHLQTVPLHQFGIVDTASSLVNSEADRYYFLDVYLQQKGEKRYLLTRDEKEKKYTSYALPLEFGPIRDTFSTPRDGERAVYLIAADLAGGGKALYDYRLDLASGVLTRGQALAEWAAELPSRWRFTGDLSYNYLVGGSGDTLLVLGDDGGFSGFHADSYLYGVERQTGKEKWSVYGGYLPIQFFIDAGGKTVTVAVKPAGNQPHRVMRLELASGRAVWRKQLQEWGAFDEFGLAGSGDTAFLYLRSPGTMSKGKLVALARNDGRVLWEKELLNGQRLLASYRPLSLPILVGREEIEGLDPRTGSSVWRLEAPVNLDDLRANFDRLSVIDDPRYWGGGKQTDKYWFKMSDRFRLVDLKNGEILNSIANNGRRIINVLNEDYLLIRDIEGRGIYQGRAASALYSLQEGRVLWSKDEDIWSALLVESRLYYTTRDKVAAVELSKGEQLWSTSFATTFAKQPLLFGTRLVVPGEKGIFVFDSQNGRFLYQVADLYLGDPEARFQLNYYGFLTRLEDGMYAASSSGSLQLLSIPAATD